MITAGSVVIADVVATLVWKEPISAAYATIRQNEARTELADTAQSFLDDLKLPPSPGADPAVRSRTLADAFSRRLEAGAPIGAIEIASAGIDYVIVEGTDTSSLERGPGHYPDTALPGQDSTIGIAGHRTTYGAPFRDIDEIEMGDEIELKMPYGTFTYAVEKSRVVEPTDIQIVRDVGRERLVLTACHPVYSAAQRYAIFAELTDVTLPEGVAGPSVQNRTPPGMRAQADSASHS